MSASEMMSRQRSAALSLCAIGCVLVAVSTAEKLPIRLVWNASISVPTGFYSVSAGPPGRGDLVLITLPDTARQLAERRGYMPPNVPVLKRVAALTGDTVCRFERVVFVNGSAVATAKLSDARGLKMPRWGGCFELKSCQVFLLGDHPNSFDGRYFGVADLAGIHGVARTLWIDAK